MNITRGGQVIAHHLHMLLQVMSKSFRVAYFIAITVFVVLSFLRIEEKQIRMYFKSIDELFTEHLAPENQTNHYKNMHLVRNQTHVNRILLEHFKYSLISFFITFVGTTFVFRLCQHLDLF